MGVRGLTRLIRLACLGNIVSLENCTIVIDCWALVHYLYEKNNLDPCFGGQTYFFHNAVEKFLKENLEYNVKMILVCDGCSDIEVKEQSKISRMNQIIQKSSNPFQRLKFKIEPYYCQMVGEICKNLGIKCFVTNGYFFL